MLAEKSNDKVIISERTKTLAKTTQKRLLTDFYRLGGMLYHPTQNNPLKLTIMTTRKYNMIRKFTYLDGRTFTDIFAYLENSIDMSIFTAKQIAMIMEICYDQHNKGYDKCAHENSLY